MLLKCRVWKEEPEVWDEDSCVMSDYKTDSDGGGVVDCDCSIPGYVGVFLKTVDGSYVHIPETETVWSKKMKFK